MHIDSFKRLIETELLPHITLIAEKPFDPILVVNNSSSWNLVGNGNYAAVFVHHSKPEWVVKIYGRNHEELHNEVRVYKKLGKHPSFSTLYGYGENYLVLKRLEGITLYNAVIKGIPIPPSIIEDIDSGLKYARSVGLNPFDIHGKNIVMYKDKGYIVDISDFYKLGTCEKWTDLKKAYFKIYKPYIYKFHPPFPHFILDIIRKGYRLYKRLFSKKVHC